MKSQQDYLPCSHGCDVICSWKQETKVFSRFSRGQVVADALHHNVDLGKGSFTAGLPHTAVDADMDLKRRFSQTI